MMTPALFLYVTADMKCQGTTWCGKPCEATCECTIQPGVDFLDIEEMKFMLAEVAEQEHHWKDLGYGLICRDCLNFETQDYDSGDYDHY